MSELLRVDLSKAEVHELRVLAAKAGMDRSKFYRRALETAPNTSPAFSTPRTKETRNP